MRTAIWTLTRSSFIHGWNCNDLLGVGSWSNNGKISTTSIANMRIGTGNSFPEPSRVLLRPAKKAFEISRALDAPKFVGARALAL